MAGRLDPGDRSRRRQPVAWTLLFLFTVALAGIGIAYALILNDVLACPTPGRDSSYGGPVLVCATTRTSVHLDSD